MVLDDIKIVMAFGETKDPDHDLAFALRPKSNLDITSIAMKFVNEIRLGRENALVMRSADPRIADTGCIARFSGMSTTIFVEQAEVELLGSKIKKHPKESYLFVKKEWAKAMGLATWDSIWVTTDPAFAYNITGGMTPQINRITGKPVPVSKFIAGELAFQRKGV